MAKSTRKNKVKTDTVEDLKNQTTKKQPLQKGYNEQNPTQEQGAFKPDNAKK